MLTANQLDKIADEYCKNNAGSYLDYKAGFRKCENIMQAENEKLKAHVATLREATEYYMNGVTHFFNTINWAKSALDAESIQFMNEHGVKFANALKETK